MYFFLNGHSPENLSPAVTEIITFLLIYILLAVFLLGFIRCDRAWYLFNTSNFVLIFLKTKLSSSQGCLRKFDFKVR